MVMKIMLTVLLLIAPTVRAEPPRCDPPFCAGMDEKSCAIAVAVWQHLAHDADKRDRSNKEMERLEREGGKDKLAACEKWAREHGKPDDSPGKGPKP